MAVAPSIQQPMGVEPAGRRAAMTATDERILAAGLRA
jgi:hypothetical protein